LFYVSTEIQALTKNPHNCLYENNTSPEAARIIATSEQPLKNGEKDTMSFKIKG